MVTEPGTLGIMPNVGCLGNQGRIFSIDVNMLFCKIDVRKAWLCKGSGIDIDLNISTNTIDTF